MYNISYSSLDDFIKKNSSYPLDTCKVCGKENELEMMVVTVRFPGKIMEFEELPVLRCQTCGNIQISAYSVKIVYQLFRTMQENGQPKGIFKPTGYREHFEYCTDVEFKYDHRDYEGIPGLNVDEEHSIKGFLTPVYFDKKALVYFMHDEDYSINLFSESYGTLEKVGGWSIPFGLNSNDKVVFWLGDLNYLDLRDRQLLLPHNIESDHKLICSEFYAAQLCCQWSDPNIERRIFGKKAELVNAINNKYKVDISHLNDEVKEKIESFQKPVTFTEKSIEPAINALHKVVIEGINSDEFCKVYEATHDKLEKGYKSWKCIKHFQELLKVLYPTKKSDEIRDLMSPLYLLNDMRIYYDHLISNEKKEEIKTNIMNTLGMDDFNDFRFIYQTINDKLLVLYRVFLLELESQSTKTKEDINGYYSSNCKCNKGCS